jgi:hypothetical protein
MAKAKFPIVRKKFPIARAYPRFFVVDGCRTLLAPFDRSIRDVAHHYANFLKEQAQEHQPAVVRIHAHNFAAAESAKETERKKRHHRFLCASVRWFLVKLANTLSFDLIATS